MLHASGSVIEPTLTMYTTGDLFSRQLSYNRFNVCINEPFIRCLCPIPQNIAALILNCAGTTRFTMVHMEHIF